MVDDPKRRRRTTEPEDATLGVDVDSALNEISQLGRHVADELVARGHIGSGIADESHPRIPGWRVVHVKEAVGGLLRRPIGQLLIGKVEEEIAIEVVPSADRQRTSDIWVKACAIDARRWDWQDRPSGGTKRWPVPSA